MTELRLRAEALMREYAEDMTDLSERDARRLIHELHVHQIELELQNEELRQAQTALETSRSWYIDLYEFAPVGYFTLNKEAMIIEANLTGAAMLGVSRSQLINGRFESQIALEDRDRFYFSVRAVLQNNAPQSCELWLLGRNGQRLFAQIELQAKATPQGETQIRLVLIDRTKHKQAEDRQQLALNILKLLNQTTAKQNPLREILMLIKEFSGVDAVAIRLRRSEDFPYAETIGFTEAFVQAENSLVVRDCDGKIRCDANGNAFLECLCGNVLAGRINPKIPFFTARGSFWTNSITTLLASMTEAERQATTRNRCHAAGYESVALIPFRNGDEILGLLQMNDSRAGLFTPEFVSFLEELGESFCIMLWRLHVEEQLRLALGEVHHRTKNNMTAIIGLIAIQTAHIMDPRLQAMFNDLRNRIYSMAIVHEQLYRSDLACVNLKNYIKYLALILLDSYKMRSERVGMMFDLDEVTLPLDSAMPFGLLLNELLTNVLKHAFPNGRAGELRICLHVTSDKHIDLRICDNGVGLPEQFDAAMATTFGVKMIVNLAEAQLHGSIVFHRRDPSGTEVQLVIPVPAEKHARAY